MSSVHRSTQDHSSWPTSSKPCMGLCKCIGSSLFNFSKLIFTNANFMPHFIHLWPVAVHAFSISHWRQALNTSLISLPFPTPNTISYVSACKGRAFICYIEKIFGQIWAKCTQMGTAQNSTFVDLTSWVKESVSMRCSSMTMILMSVFMFIESQRQTPQPTTSRPAFAHLHYNSIVIHYTPL